MNNSVESLKGVPTHRSAFRGRRVIDAMPVELLLDQRGVYGIGVAEECDVEAPGRAALNMLLNSSAGLPPAVTPTATDRGAAKDPRTTPDFLEHD